MLTIPSVPDCFLAELSSTRMSLTHDEQRQLIRMQAIAAAERHLVPLDRPCVDHQACRRLAFALWLRASGRLPEDVPEHVAFGDGRGDA